MFDFLVKPDGAVEFRVTATSRDLSKWERDFSKFGASLRKIQTEMKMSDLEQLCWVAVTRRELWMGTLSEFRATCDIVPEEEEKSTPDDERVGASDPTKPDH